MGYWNADLILYPILMEERIPFEFKLIGSLDEINVPFMKLWMEATAYRNMKFKDASLKTIKQTSSVRAKLASKKDFIVPMSSQ
jgi:hypothetical protein